MSFMQSIIAYFLSPLVNLLIFLIFIRVVMSWLVGFGIVNIHNPTMRQIYQIIEALTEPIMGPLRRIIPPIGGLDLSPIVAFFGLSWLNGYVLNQLLFPMLG